MIMTKIIKIMTNDTQGTISEQQRSYERNKEKNLKSTIKITKKD